MKIAIVDLGSNTIRLSVYNTLPDGGFELLFSEKEMAGLVSYVHGGVLSPEGIQRACQGIRDFQTLLRQFGLGMPHVFATASLRNIRNTEEALAQIHDATGAEVDVISGELEARLGYYGTRLSADLRDGAVFDIGGGSTEILDLRDGEIRKARSLPIGSLELFNECVDGIWPRRKELEKLRRTVEEALRGARLPKKPAPRACGVGGTARAALKIANAWYGRPASNRVLTPAELRRLTKLLLKRDHQARKLILRHCPDRVHTILPGLVLMEMLVEELCEEELYISPYGVREGYLCHKLLGTGT